MFYSHQLLARKAPLGQIWMAATLHGKINRRKLDKLNIINIWFEEILNPSIPMALRLSGILMGGVVIVYERKVKLLYDDVTRLMVEINQAWKTKPVSDPTVLPKGKSQAKKEAVTLPEKKDADVEDIIEASLNFSNTGATTMEFQQTAYFAMRLDNIDETYVNNDQGKEDMSHQPHQADADNINLFERFDSYQVNTETYNHFERFDIDMDEETQPNFTSGERAEIPTTLIPSPPQENNARGAVDEIKDDYPEIQVNQKSDECREVKQDVQRQGPVKRNVNRQAGPAMDYEQTIIPGHVYQAWLQNTSDIVSKRGRKRKSRIDILSTRKVANLMEHPPMVLIDDLYNKSNGEIYYPAPIMELWTQSNRPPHDIPSERTSQPPPPEPSISSPPQQFHHAEQLGNEFQDLHSGVDSQSLGTSMEKQRANVQQDMPTEIPDFLIRKSDPNLINNGTRAAESGFMTPGNAADEVRSMSSSGSGHGIPEHPQRLNKKRTGSASRHSGSSLEVVEEEPNYPDPNFRLSRLSENGPTTDPELLVETGPTQTQHRIISQPFDQITDKIKTQMKAHFETPGNPQTESLNKLANGMSRKQAAILFYQTCVLATRDCLKVQQKVPYGDILISKGAKM